MSVMSQDEYIAILFGDCGFDSAARRAWLKAEFGCAYSDGLTPTQKHLCIERLKGIKESARADYDPNEDYRK